MAGDVTYMTGDMMKVAIQTANQAVAGMSVSEAAAVLGATAQTQTNGTQILTFPIPYQQYGQVSTEAMYAAQLWEYWKAAGNAAGTTAFGAAGAAALSWASFRSRVSNFCGNCTFISSDLSVNPSTANMGDAYVGQSAMAELAAQPQK